jgi:thiol-disulfide isomerase/thioredoxin
MSPDSAPAPIDPRGPRTNQAVLAAALVLAGLTSQEWVVPVFAVVLFLGAAFGPRYGPVLRLYQALIKPRLAPPQHLEDPRPPRFAAAVGVVFLGASTLAFVLGAGAVGWGLALVVAALAALAAATGLCVGCEMYVWFVRLRGGVRVVTVDRTDAHDGKVDVAHGEHPPLPADLAADEETWVVFSTEYCAVCPTVVSMIQAARPEAVVRVVDVADEPSLAARYKVRRAPTVLRAEPGGRVVTRTAGADGVRSELHDLEILAPGGVTPAA